MLLGKLRLEKATDEDAIRWLLTSPFNRDEAGIRKKVIATSGQTNNAIEKLATSGYQIIPFGENTSNQTLEDISVEVDAVWTADGTLPISTIEQIINKQGKILWVEHLTNADNYN